MFFSASPLRTTELIEGLYTKREISPNYTLFWRIIPDTAEIEMAMRVKGTGFVGIGWRPKSATKKCQALPILQDKQKSSPKSLWTNEKKSAEPEAEAEGESAEEKSADAESADAESAVAESADAEGKSLEDILAEESSEEENSSKELTRKARKIVNKSVDVSIGYVTHSVSTGKRRRRQAEKEEGIIIFFRQFVGGSWFNQKKF